MITMKELLGRPMQIPPEHMANLETLLVKLNQFREAYGKPLSVTSGYRSLEHHLEIYRQKGITDQSKIPMKSNHLFGLAADVVPVGEQVGYLQEWVVDHEPLCADIGLWFESLDATPDWVHCQIVPSKSGLRFFKP